MATKPSVGEIVERSIIKPVSLLELSVYVSVTPVVPTVPVKLLGMFAPVIDAAQSSVYWLSGPNRKASPSAIRPCCPVVNKLPQVMG